MGDCQNYGPFLGPYYNTGPNTGPNLGNPKRDHNFDNPPYPLLRGAVGSPDATSPAPAGMTSLENPLPLIINPPTPLIINTPQIW